MLLNRMLPETRIWEVVAPVFSTELFAGLTGQAEPPSVESEDIGRKTMTKKAMQDSQTGTSTVAAKMM